MLNYGGLFIRLKKKRKKLALGAYLSVTLETARRKADEARDNIANGIDPGEIRSEKKKAQQLSILNNKRVADGLPMLNSFVDITKQWLALRKPQGLNA